MNPYKDAEDSSFTASLRLCYEDIASKLLKDHYFLTALELHTELVESGKELPQLREFFSNPGNFEQHVSRASDFISMHRTPSLATLDSLDTARYSEDGGGDRGGSGGDVAVLEFELRKAKETINCLRANLTQFADGESALDKKSSDNHQRSLKPHEKRALNFLINEYLLLQDYKLTSITFSDENPDQEFEDWDDVGLNMPRPDGLVSLFWGGTGQINSPKVDAATEIDKRIMYNVQCQTEIYEENGCVNCQTSIDNDAAWNHELLIQAEEIEYLKQKIIALETEKLNFQKLYDAAIVSLNSLTSPASENKGLILQIPEEKMPSGPPELAEQQDVKPITYMASENHYGSGNSTNSATPDQFEMVYNEKNNILIKKEGSNTSSYDPAIFVDSSVRGSPVRPGSVTTLDETLSINDAGEWTRVQYDCTAIENNKEMWIDSSVPNNLKDSLLNWCQEIFDKDEPLSNDLLSELVTSKKPITLNGLLPLVADTLPRMLPHTLVARRGEAAALLAAGAALLPPGDARRARLLHALLTLYKKPEPRDAHAVCQAACLVVKWGGSGEVLSSVAELLTSKTTERRLLASQVCLAIAPYVPLELCASLLFSLVLLMCDSSEREIRSIGLKAACLVCPVAEHKYSQLENILFNFLKDPSDKNVQDTVNVFIPIIARSALISGKFSTELYNRVINNFSKASGEGDWKNVLLYLDVMRVLVLEELVYVTNVQVVKDADSSDCDIATSTLQDVPLSEKINLIDLQCLISDEMDVKVLLACLNSLLKRKPEVRWAELNWFIDSLKQILDIATRNKMLNNHSVYELLIALFNTYIENFGIQFTLKILRPIFTDIIVELEQKLEKLHAVSVDRFVVVGVYIATVLISVEESERCGEFLQKWVVYCGISGLPVNIFSVPFKWLAKHNPNVLSSYFKHLKEFSASSCDSSSVSAIRSYIANLVTELLNMANIGDECLEDHVVPIALALLDDEDVGVREAGIMAWGGAWRECSTRAEEGERGDAEEMLARGAERCAQGAELLLRRALTAREASRMAHALALLVLPADQRGQADTAVSLLCTLCARAPMAGEVVAALSAGLQLAAHHRPTHAALLPALRRLEEVVQTPSLSQYKPTVDALLHVVGTGASVGGAAGGGGREAGPRLDAAHEVGRRVSQMFQAKANMNLHNIFKKKT